MEEIQKILSSINDFVWGVPMVALLFGTHLFLTFRLKFIQRYIFKAIKISLERSKEGEGDVSQFGALATALAATIGTGNIVGVASAISSGGPGAVLWMWLTGVFGISTKFAEALLSVKYRVKNPDGQMAGGPMYVLERGMGMRWLGIIFAALTAVAAFGIGNMVQANSISTMLMETWGVPTWLSGIIMTILTAVVILGGIKSIARVCEALVPFMAFFYVLGCLILLAMKFQQIPETVMLILNSAFSGQAAVGGFMGSTIAQAMRFGIARGLFSNESGLGSAPIVAAAAQTKTPIRQALVSSTGTFWDTVVVCLITGLVVVNSGDWKAAGADLSKLKPETVSELKAQGIIDGRGLDFSKLTPQFKERFLQEKVWKQVRVTSSEFPPDLHSQLQNSGALANQVVATEKLADADRKLLSTAPGWLPEAPKGAVLTKMAFAEITTIGPIILGVGLLTFVFSTILGWGYYGEKAAEFLFGARIIVPYRYAWVVAVMVGSVILPQMVWDFADIANALMAIPNLISLLVLNNVIVQEVRAELWEGPPADPEA